MADESLSQRVLHLRQVERLSQQQIADVLGIGRKRVRLMLDSITQTDTLLVRKGLLDSYRNLIMEWYRQYPRLMGKQVYARLIEYGYTGSYVTVARMTKELRRVKLQAYYPLIFLPGEEAQVECDGNKYSVPTSCVGQLAQLYIYPLQIEVWVSQQKVAVHKRCFDRRRHIHSPLHEDRQLNQTPDYKMQRVYRVITQLDPAFLQFIDSRDETVEREETAYEIYTLLRTHSRSMVLSAVRELNAMGTYKTKALRSLLNLPLVKEPEAV